MIISNPNGFKKYKVSNILNFMNIQFDKNSDIMITYNIADGTKLTQIIPLNSLSTVSKYCNVQISAVDFYNLKLYEILQEMAEDVVKVYESLGIRIRSYDIKAIKGELENDHIQSRTK